MTQFLQDRMAETWNNSRPSVRHQLDHILAVVTLPGGAGAPPAACLAAAKEAHQIAGYAGSFGFSRASRLAGEIETMLKDAAGPSPSPVLDQGRLGKLHRDLSAELAKDLPKSVDSLPKQIGSDLRLLAVGDDVALTRAIVVEAERRGARVATACCLAAAREAIASHTPDLIFLDAELEGGEDGLALLAGHIPPAAAVVVLTSRRDTAVHVRAAELGASGFLDKSKPVRLILDAGFDFVRKEEHCEYRILAVDDDRVFLAALRGMLPKTARFTGLSDPRSFWETLETTQPDLLLLDQNMPAFSGIQLCRAVRADAQWRHIPILLLTADADSATIKEVFSAGADDFIRKPISGVDLRARVESRLERMASFRRLAERDPLTNLLNRRRAYDVLGRYVALAKRQDTPLGVALLDLDHFKKVNDRYGHSAGDAVLRRLAELLLTSFRGEDVVARWGGEEFLVGMYGASETESTRKIGLVLEELREEQFQSDENTFRVSFSCGVAQLHRDGLEVDTLIASADAALYRAKAQGRNRVVGPEPSTSAASEAGKDEARSPVPQS